MPDQRNQSFDPFFCIPCYPPESSQIIRIKWHKSKEKSSKYSKLNDIFIYGCKETSNSWAGQTFDGVDVLAKGGNGIVGFEEGVFNVKKDTNGNLGVALTYPTNKGFRIRYLLIDDNFNKLSQISEINTF